jgi:predicted SAM-dependent methyltransferase
VFSLGDKQFIKQAYRFILRRSPDEGGLNHFLKELGKGRISREQLLGQMVSSREFTETVLFPNLGTALHFSRCQFVKSLPVAKHILDLGGTASASPDGALVSMGYPYRFDQLTIVDLPSDERHPNYAYGDAYSTHQSPLGPVSYIYQSMTDLSCFQPQSFDLVFSGQSIEHVTELEGSLVIAKVFELLVPGGYFCLDTPNRRVTSLQGENFVDPDHKIEYTHTVLSKKLTDAGFKICEAKGLHYARECLDSGSFSEQQVARKIGSYWAIEDCYILAYVCQKP